MAVNDYAEQVIHNIKQNIRYLREYRGMTQKELADITGVTPQYISALERVGGEKGPTIKNLAKLAEALGTTAGRLVDVRISKTIEQLVEESFSDLED